MNELLIKIDSETFNKWLTDGFLLAKKSGRRSTKKMNYFLVSLPQKYQKVVQNNQPFMILIDDVNRISASSPMETQTEEIKHKNLGEGHLIFNYVPFNEKDAIRIERFQTRSQGTSNTKPKKESKADQPTQPQSTSKEYQGVSPDQQPN